MRCTRLFKNLLGRSWLWSVFLCIMKRRVRRRCERSRSLRRWIIVNILDMFVVRKTLFSLRWTVTDLPARHPLSVYMVFPYMDHDLAGLLENERVKLQPSHIKTLHEAAIGRNWVYAPSKSRPCLSFILSLTSPSSRTTFYIVIWRLPIYLSRELQILACLGRMTRTFQILAKADTEAKNANTLTALLRGGIVPQNFWWVLDSMAERLTFGALVAFFSLSLTDNKFSIFAPSCVLG